MKKKNIIICSIAAIVLAGASAVAAYTLDSIGSVNPGASVAEQLAAEEKVNAEVLAKWQSTADILVQAMAGNEHFTEEEIRAEKENALYSDRVRDCFSMSEAQVKEYVERLGLIKKRAGISCSFPRIRDEILGKMSPNTQRLTVEALDELVKESHNSVELYNNIRSQYGDPDFGCQFSGRYGETIQYWLDDEGTEWIDLIVVPYSDNNRGVESIELKNYEDYYGFGKTLYSDTDLKALFGE